MPTKRETTLALYEKLVATQPGMKIKGAKSAYTSMNGRMFSFVTQEGGFALRLPKALYDEFLEKKGATTVVQYGATMREYVLVPETLLRRTKTMARYFQAAVDHVASLPPQPTTKPKKKAAKRKTTKKATRKKAAAKSTTKKASARAKKA